MSRAVPSEWKNEDTNSVPWSEVTCDGTPCFENMWSTNSFASIRAVMVSTVGMNSVSALCTYFHTMLPLEHGILYILMVVV